MAWTTPRTWVNGEVITDVLLNTHVRDNLLALKAVDDATTGVHGLGTGVALVGCKQGTRRIEVRSGSVEFTRQEQGSYIATITVSWSNAFTSMIACFVCPAPGTSYGWPASGISSRSVTGASGQFSAWFDVGTHSIYADFLGIGT